MKKENSDEVHCRACCLRPLCGARSLTDEELGLIKKNGLTALARRNRARRGRCGPELAILFAVTLMVRPRMAAVAMIWLTAGYALATGIFEVLLGI